MPEERKTEIRKPQASVSSLHSEAPVKRGEQPILCHVDRRAHLSKRSVSHARICRQRKAHQELSRQRMWAFRCRHDGGRSCACRKKQHVSAIPPAVKVLCTFVDSNFVISRLGWQQRFGIEHVKTCFDVLDRSNVFDAATTAAWPLQEFQSAPHCRVVTIMRRLHDNKARV